MKLTCETPCYKCGHEVTPIFVGANPFLVEAYFVWRRDYAGEMCFECYCEKLRRGEIQR